MIAGLRAAIKRTAPAFRAALRLYRDNAKRVRALRRAARRGPRKEER